MNYTELPDIKQTNLGSNKHLVYIHDEIDFSTYPEAEIRQKLAKNRSWSVCKSGMNKDKKLFWYEVMLNANETALRMITFDEACKDLHWSKLELINNDQTIKWFEDKEYNKLIDELNEKMKQQSPKKDDKMKETTVWHTRGEVDNYAYWK